MTANPPTVRSIFARVLQKSRFGIEYKLDGGVEQLALALSDAGLAESQLDALLRGEAVITPKSWLDGVEALARKRIACKECQ